MRVRLALQARADLDAIWLHMAREVGSVDSATRLIDSIAEKFKLLARFPSIGKSLPSDLRDNVRTLPVNQYLIFYSPRASEIRILRVLHTSRDAMAVFAESLGSELPAAPPAPEI
jgi:toxin ParE1/3/4